jgi:hypothetical protein
VTSLDLESIKQIAETDKDYFPKDFIAQCLKHCSHPDHIYLPEVKRLFLDAFTWSVEEFGPTSPGYYGLGKSKEEVIDLYKDDDIEVLRRNFLHILGGISHMFYNLSLVVVKSLIESFGEEDRMYAVIARCLVRILGYNQDPHTAERWGKFKMMVEYLITQTVTDEGEDNEEEGWTKGDDGKVLIGHALFLLFARCVVYEVRQCLLFAKGHQPNVFLVRNKQGRTLLDIVIKHHGRLRCDRNEIVRLIVQEDPDTCLQRGRDGRLPIHLALRMKDQDFHLFNLIFNAATSVANQKCPTTHLYPYQLAAVQYTDSNTPDDEAPDWSGSEEEGADEEDYDVPDKEDSYLARSNLSCIYKLLRQSPNLVGDGISPDCHMLSHPESIAIAKDELELTNIRDSHFQIERDCAAQHRQIERECAAQHRKIEREQAAKVNERKRKHRSSSQAT